MFFSVFLFILVALFFGYTGVWIYTIIDLVRSPFDSNTNKIIWLLVVMFMLVLGTILYWLLGTVHKIDSEETPEPDDTPEPDEFL